VDGYVVGRTTMLVLKSLIDQGSWPSASVHIDPVLIEPNREG
jgi:hypothetical protein